ncbi:diacylglycerol kinase family protein [uncultured Rubinisphaera sp.]|uniref:diacylglycerol kinase family protein n=1 Tax=uncultured Rubinisphaera sp. TaxID=1678686 RepID=UPI000ED29582|nr:diacylglycerol kinase [Planctomycetaceae bacterium]
MPSKSRHSHCFELIDPHDRTETESRQADTAAVSRLAPLRFSNGFRGIGIALKNERNLRLQMGIAIVVIIAGIVYQLSQLEWAIISLTIAFVLMAEMLNTALENTLDRISLEEHPLTRNAKDVAAGAVLISSMAALIVGGLIFLPKVIG